MNALDYDFRISDYIDIKNICESIDNRNTPFELIKNKLRYNSIFSKEGEIIYYASAMKYLTENDESFRLSLDLANDFKIK